MIHTINVSDKFLAQIALIEMIKTDLPGGGRSRACPLCNRQVSYYDGHPPIPHAADCAWVEANNIILSMK